MLNHINFVYKIEFMTVHESYNISTLSNAVATCMVNVTSVACGMYHTAVIADGKVYMFGATEYITVRSNAYGLSCAPLVFTGADIV